MPIPTNLAVVGQLSKLCLRQSETFLTLGIGIVHPHPETEDLTLLAKVLPTPPTAVSDVVRRGEPEVFADDALAASDTGEVDESEEKELRGEHVAVGRIGIGIQGQVMGKTV